MPNSIVQLDQIADVFTGHYEQGAGVDNPAGTHRLVFIGSIDAGPAHRLLPDKCPRFTPKIDPGESLLRPGDLVMPARGERQDVAIIDLNPDNRPLVAASFLHVVRPNPDAADPGYLAWWLNQPTVRARVTGRVRGTKMPFLPLSETRTIRVTLPPLDVQQRIAELHRLVVRASDISIELLDLRSRLTNGLALRIANGEIA